MDYQKIGQRIRKYRRASGLSQEALAEQINISTTHMSHIETGNTKLSLPVLVDIAKVLRVRTDDLLQESSIPSKSAALQDIAVLLEQCSPKQAQLVAELVYATKQCIDKHI